MNPILDAAEGATRGALEATVGKVADRLASWIPDKDAASKAAREVAVMLAESDRQQSAVNAVEAASESLFVSGWRPAVGWVCVAALASTYLVRPFVLWGSALAGRALELPQLDMSELLTLLVGMLGLSVVRTAEKIRGVARS